MVRSVAKAVGFGLLAVVLGLLRIQLPGTNSIATDLSETAMIGSAFSLSRPWLTLIPCAIQALNTVPGRFFVHPDSTNTFFMHAACVPAAWWAHRALQRRSLGYVQVGLLWATFVVAYYYVFMLPGLIGSHWLFQTATLAKHGVLDLYLSTARAFSYELLFTAGVTSLAFITKEELRRRRAAEVRLREALDVQQAMLAAAPVAVFSVSSGGAVSSWNPAAERLFGIPATQALGGPPPPLGSIVERVLAGAPVLAVESESPTSSGDPIPVSVSGAPLRDDSGAPSGAILLVEDLRQQLALRAQVQRSATMAALGQLVGGVAHELRNPLFGISATLDAFATQFVAHPRLLQMDKLLRGQVEQLNALALDLLDYGKSGVGQLTLGSIETPLRLAVGECAARAAESGVTLDLALPAGLAPVAMDAPRLLQVFRNLIQNALAFSPPGGAVRIECVAEADLVRIDVLDRGSGFAPADLPNVFEPFFSRRTGGTGLGLSVVQRIVERHGGTVEAKAREGGGAQMVVRLPVSHP